jgi:hypothetical protein
LLKQKIGGGKKSLSGYRGNQQRPRNNLERDTFRGLELFGIARNVSREPVDTGSVVLQGLINTIPRLSRGAISKREVKITPSQKLLNRGQVSSALARSRKKIIEPKDLRRWEREIKNVVNGSGHQPLSLSAEDFVPAVINSRGKLIGTLYIDENSPHFGQLVEANERAINALRDESRADSCDSRAALTPRIDVFQARDREIADKVIHGIADQLVEKTAVVVLDPADVYRTAA